MNELDADALKAKGVTFSTKEAIISGSIGSAEGEDGMGIGDMLKNAMGGITGDLETKVINASEYVL